MRSLNRVTLIGNVGRDPEIRAIPTGAKVATFSVATSESYNDRNGQRVDKTEWHKVVMWRNLADIAERFVRKGSQIFVEGKLQTRSWDDPNGQKRYITEIVGDNLILLGSGSGAGGGGGQGGGSYGNDPGPTEDDFSGAAAPRSQGNNRSNQGGGGQGSGSSGGIPPLPEDDLPF